MRLLCDFMMEEIRTFTKGDLVTMATGEYSDYCVNGLFKVLKDFDANKLMIIWANETGRKVDNGTVEGDWQNEKIEFLPWVANNGFIEDVSYRELHLGSYGETHLSSLDT